MSSFDRPDPPRYEQIQNDLIEKIQCGQYKPGDRIPSEKEISSIYHVSRITASKALTELSLSGYIYRVQGKGSFANPLGKHLRASDLKAAQPAVSDDSHHQIGLIIPEHFDYHSGNIIRSVTCELAYPDYYVHIVVTRNAGLEEHALESFLKEGFAGVILFPNDCEYYSNIILQMHLNHFPLVMIDRRFPGINSSSVTCDNELGARLATEHLFALGHRNIAFVADNTRKEQITAQRYNGYQAAMDAGKLPAASYEGIGKMEKDDDAPLQLVEDIRKGRLTAAVLSNSHIALRFSDLCRRHNIRIPQDLSIVCFDNPGCHWGCTEDFFTYIDQGSSEMGQAAARLLVEAIAKGGAAESQQLVLTPTLVVNRSTQSLKEAVM